MSRLSLEFAKDADGNTFLNKQFASYPFHICRTQYMENDPPGMANIYIQSASGGIYENESLITDVTANAGSYSHVTTQASTIVHGMPNGAAHQVVNIMATGNAYTEYVSDPLILFPKSTLGTEINVVADESSSAVIADAFLLHFLEGDDQVFNQLDSYLNIYSEHNELLAKDVYLVKPTNFLQGRCQYIGMGTISLIHRSGSMQPLLELLQQSMQSNDEIYGGATLLPNECGIIVKFLAPDGDSLKKTTLKTWMQIREFIVGITPNIRRK